MSQSNTYSNEHIEELADQILKDNDMSIPVDLLELAANMGINIYEMDLDEWNASGMISRERGITEVYIDENESATRKRFTIAHEFGHLFLHMEEDVDSNFLDGEPVLYRRGKDNFSTDPSKEREANRFAAALLMPARIVQDEWKMSYSVGRMALKFLVSPQAMENRLRTLGLI